MSGHTIEIVSPAGSLTAGIYALEAGADALYFGLERFSARKAAQNLTMTDVRRLRGEASKHDARIFAAINTVIAEDERALLDSWIPELILSGVDGVIVQDLGLAHHIRQRFPELPLHGSTQLAVHNRPGLETAAALAFKRVVLSRELSIEEIAALRSTAPAVEREVFVHGALCYGFSGLCLASDLLTGRSGNRGACAQICRSWFERDGDKGYFFSLRDLDAGPLVQALSTAGVTALKIEGRLKNLPYIYNTTAYYRALLRGDGDKAAHYLKKSALGFSRPRTTGFLKQGKQRRLTHPAYPSHIGIPGAEVVSVKGRDIEIRALDDLARHDRLFRVPEGPPDPGATFPIAHLIVNGRKQGKIKKGQRARLQGVSGVAPKQILMKTLSHDMHLKAPSPHRYPEHKRPLPLWVRVTPDAVVLGTRVLGIVVEERYPVPIEPSRGDHPLTSIMLKRFGVSKDHPFTFDTVTPFPGEPPVPTDRFIPPSALKQIRNRFFDTVSARVLAPRDPSPVVDIASAFPHPLPPRDAITYVDGFPFVPEGVTSRGDDWPTIDGRIYLSLPPVIFDVDETVSLLETQLAGLGDRPVAVGLNNIAHLAIAKRWRRFDNLSFYADYGLYTANLWTLAFLLKRVHRLEGAYLWLEAVADQQAALRDAVAGASGALPPGLRFIEHKAQFPMFISRVCLHGLQGPHRCGRRCPGTFDAPLSQNRRRFTAKVRGCMTYLFADTPSAAK